MTPFALLGAGLGLGLGAVYLAAGLGETAEAHADSARRQEALTTAFQPQTPAETYDLIDPTQSPRTVSVPKAKPSEIRTSDLDCLTAAVYFEARGETQRGQAAVAQVVLNRVLHPAFPKTVCGVVYQGAGRHSCQFSFACDGHADVSRETGAWKSARRVALHALAGGADEEVGAATHFHASRVAPAWGPQMLRVAQIGLHVFYQLNPHGTPRAKPAPEKPQVMLASAVLPADQAAALHVEPAVTPAPNAVAAAEADEPEAASAPAKPERPDAAPAAADRKPG